MLRAVGGLLFPLVCPGCGAPAARDAAVCGACVETLRPAPPLGVPAGLSSLSVAFAYEGVAREVVARVKYRNARAAVPWLAHAMVAALVPSTAVGVVTWAPTTAARRRARGFDHAEVIARAVAKELARPCAGLLARRAGAAQTGARRAERSQRPSFRARRPLVGARVLLVDDVVTTGATLRAACRALLASGALAVDGLAAARTP